ncbi:MAG TPA: AAA family ATPase [Firmicutes bacterium]|nr:AAA family ATPase [Bacillota bacterium]
MGTITANKEMIKLYARQLKTPTFLNYDEVIRQLDPNEGYEVFLKELMRNEVLQRQENLQKRRIKTAKFPVYKTIDEFDLDCLENVSKAYILELANCDFIKEKQNILMIGNCGSGKTHLALALGLKACQCGFNVRFYTAVNLATELSEAFQEGRLSRFEKNLAKVDLLIIDELSYLTFNRHHSELLFQVISERSERGSVIITTNLEFSKWTELFENEMMVSALIDRVTFRSHILDMNVSESYRFKETKKRLQQETVDN